MTLVVRQAGMLSTVQDRGRTQWQHLGVPVSGSMDLTAHRIANILVGNTEDAATIECTLGGAAFQFTQPMLFAIAGRQCQASLDGVPVLPWRSLAAHAGALLALHNGVRTTLAVGGGVSVPRVLDSRSTSLRAGFGGFDGRPLKRDDVVTCGAESSLSAHLRELLTSEGRSVSDWSAGAGVRPGYSAEPTVRIIRGPQFDALDEHSQRVLLRDAFRVSNESDRMGFRLTGPPLALAHAQELTSSAVTFGTIQLPPGGSPIVLMADRQTTGGYPRIADVISVDLPLLAQLQPGDSVRFVTTTVDQAHTLRRAHDAACASAERAIKLLAESGRDAIR
jgi:antagonist of KipI